MCLAQGPQRSDAGEVRTVAPLSRVKHSTTEPLHPRFWNELIAHGASMIRCVIMRNLILCLLVVSAHKHCKTFDPDLAQETLGPDLDAICLTLVVFLNFLEKLILENN